MLGFEKPAAQRVQAMVTKAEVEMAYRLILGREPENEDVVASHALPTRKLADLRRDFLSDAEFAANYGRVVLQQQSSGTKPLIWRKTEVEVHVEDRKLQRMIGRIEKEFEYLGKTEPHWSVIAQEEYKTINIKGKEDQFFRSGKGVVDDFMIAAARCGIDLSKLQTCFELGCGLGRSTVWLAKQFRDVVGADVSKEHLRLAKEAVQRLGMTNVRLVHVNTIASLATLDSFDAFFSIIVLQHNPPPLIATMLNSFLAKLKPGGVAYFQVPTYIMNYGFKADTYLAREQPPGVPEMHAIPQPVLFQLVEHAGCKLIEIREDAAAGPAAISNRLLVQKNK
jgi:SAM-dependent methyltransferase